MSLPAFLKSKTFLVFVFVGTLALGTFAVVGAYLIKKGAGRQERARAQTPNTCPAFQINPTSAAANWPELVTATTQLYLNCSVGQNYGLAYFIQQTNPPGPKFTTEPSGSSHPKPCGSGGIVADTFEIKKENLKDYNTGAPAVPTCASPPCDYKIFVRWSAGSGDPWKDHSSCQANFQITPQLPACIKFEVLKNSAVVTTISPNDQIDLKVIGNVGDFVITKVKFYYKKNGASFTPVLIGEGQKTGSDHGVETWMYSHWTVPATFANGESYDFYAEPEDDHGSKCNPYQNVDICGNCKTTVTVSAAPTFNCAVVPATFNIAPGGNQSLTVTPTGGLAPYTYSWAATGGGIAGGTTSTAIWTAPTGAASGTTYTITATVKDAGTPQQTTTCTSTATITTTPTHKVCQGTTCTTVSGAGTDQCQTDANCQATTPPKCKGFTLNKTQAKDTEEVTANLTINSGSSAFVDKVFLHAATDQELANNVQHGIGPISYFKDKSGDQTTTHTFVPKTSQLIGGANKVWVSAENAQGLICTDRPGGQQGRPTCGCEVKTLTVTVCPTCQGIQMTPAAGTVSAGSPITFVATFKRGSEPSPTVSFQITKPGGTKETITCPKASPECTITSSGEQIVATLKYIPATAGQYLAKASASCGGGGQ